MKAEFLIAFKNLTYRPGRSVSCAVGIALGLAIVMAVLIVDRNTILTQTALNPKSYGEPDVEIRPLRPNPTMIGQQKLQLSEAEGITDLAALFFNTCSLRSISGATGSFQICGLDERAAEGFNAYRVSEGRDLDFFGPPNLLLSVQIAERLGVGPGDVLKVWLATPVRSVCKDGKVVALQPDGPAKAPPTMDYLVRGILAEEHLGLRDIVIASFDQAVRLFEGGYVLPIYWAKLTPGFDLTAVKAELKEEFSVDKPYRKALVGESFEERAFRNGVRLCALLSLLLGLYIIFNSMSMSLVERIRQIGLLRAMGLTHGGLSRLFLVEGFLLALAGCALSVVFTWAIVAYMMSQGITTLGFGRPLEIVEIPYLPLGGIMVLGIIFSLLGVLYPVGKAKSLSVIQAIRKGAMEFERRPFKGVGRFLFLLYVLLLPMTYFLLTPLLSGRLLEMLLLMLNIGAAVAVVIGLLLFFPALLNRGAAAVLAPLRRLFRVTGSLAHASLRTARLRVFSTVSGLALVFGAIFVIAVLFDSLLSETAGWADQNIAGQVFVRGKDREPLKAEAFLQVEGVKAAYNLSAEIQSPYPVRGLPPEAILSFGPLEGRTELAERLRQENWIIISSRLARIYHYGEGDLLKLSTPLAGLKVFKILAVCDAYGFYPDDRSFAVISSQKMESYFCITADRGDQWCLTVADGASPGTVEGALAAQLEDRASVVSGTALRDLYLEDLKRNFAIFKVIAALVALMAGLSILNSLVIAVVERRRETALLRVVGLTPAQSKGILFMEAFSLGILGGLFALVLGLPLSVLTVRSLSSISYLDLSLTLRPDTVLITCLGALAVSLVASLYPMARQGSTDLMEAVKYE